MADGRCKPSYPKKIPLLAAGLLAGASLAADAAVLLSYEFQNTLAPSVIAPGLSASDVGIGAGLSQALVGFPGDRFLLLGQFPTGDTLNPLNRDFFGFRLEPDAGKTLDLDAISFAASDFFLGPDTLQLRSSLDGFASPVAAATVPTLPGTLTFTLPGAYDAVSGPVTFAVFGYDAASSLLGVLGVDDLTVTGSVVPEPHEYAAAATLGLLGFAMWRRRRRRA